MVFDKPGMKGHIVIDENKVIAGGVGSGQIFYARLANSPVFMPDVAPGQGRRGQAFLDDICRFCRRTVIGHNDFKFAIGLLQYGGQNHCKGLGPIVGGNDQ